MKKEFIDFPVLRRGLPKMQNRRTMGRVSADQRGAACYKTDGGDGGGDETEEEKLVKQIEQRVAALLKDKASAEELRQINETVGALKELKIEALRELVDPNKGALAMLANQGLEITRLKRELNKSDAPKGIRESVSEWIGKNKTQIENLRSGVQAQLGTLEIQVRSVNSPMTPANTIASGSSANVIGRIETAPGIVDLVRPDYTFWNTIKKGTTGSNVYHWINKKNPQGAAAFIAPGVYKPGISFQISAETSVAKKIAVNEKVAMELLDDVEGFSTWIEDELIYQLYQKASLILMDSVGSTTTPTGVKQLSVPYAGAALGIKTKNPNNWDAIRACVGQLKAANFTKGGITAYINPIDMTNMLLTKANSQGQLFIPPATGATVIEDNNIPVGTLQIGLFDYYKVLIYKGFTMSFGLENDDFTKNLSTVIAEMRIHQFMGENHTGCLIRDTFDNIITEITEAEPAPEGGA